MWMYKAGSVATSMQRSKQPFLNKLQVLTQLKSFAFVNVDKKKKTPEWWVIICLRDDNQN